MDHNWAGNFQLQDVRSQLRDPDNLDFRPRENSEIIDAGALIEGKELSYEGSTPDIGPYEYGSEHYWIPGRMEKSASSPVPPDGSGTVKQDADLMWLEALDASSHRIYCSRSREEVEKSIPAPESFMGEFTGSNICTPDESFDAGSSYYWRVDAVLPDGKVVEGHIWQFTVPGQGN